MSSRRIEICEDCAKYAVKSARRPQLDEFSNEWKSQRQLHKRKSDRERGKWVSVKRRTKRGNWSLGWTIAHARNSLKLFRRWRQLNQAGLQPESKSELELELELQPETELRPEAELELASNAKSLAAVQARISPPYLPRGLLRWCDKR